MNRSKITLYGITIAVEKVKKKKQIELLKEFFNRGREWFKEGYKIYFYGIDGEARASIWNAIKTEVLDFVQIAEKFTFIAGPVFSIEKRDGKKIHPFIELLENRNKNVEIRECDARPYGCYYMLLLASKNGPNKFEKGLLIVEKPYKIIDLNKPKEVLLLELKDYDFTTKGEIRGLFAHILQEFMDEIILTREIKSPAEMLTFTDSEIKQLVKEFEEKEIDFDTVTAKELRRITKELPF
jgi:hypothetical protein